MEPGLFALQLEKPLDLNEALVEKGLNIAKLTLDEGQLTFEGRELGFRSLDLSPDLLLLFGKLLSFLPQGGASGHEKGALALDLLLEDIGRNQREFRKSPKIQSVGPVALRIQPHPPREYLGDLAFDDGQLRAQKRPVEADEHIPRLDRIAVAGEDLADHAPVGMLDHLTLALDLHRARRNDGPCNLNADAPGTETTEKEEHSCKPHDQREPRAPSLQRRAH